MFCSWCIIASRDTIPIEESAVSFDLVTVLEGFFAVFNFSRYSAAARLVDSENSDLVIGYVAISPSLPEVVWLLGSPPPASGKPL